MDIALCSTLFVQIAVASTTVMWVYIYIDERKKIRKDFQLT
jgi:hypothetical protein